jgi:hypothetical protein
MNLGKGKKLHVISQQELKENLHYDPLTGVFTWLKANSRNSKVGNIAGSLNTGYILISINGIKYRAHRLAWLYMTGEMPKSMIDHINSVKTDNRFCNLREATNQQNLQNLQKPRADSSTGFMGVGRCNKSKKYVATITDKGKPRYLGLFTTPEEAHQAYLAAKRKLHPFCTI